jgi:hypothetical protein
VHFGDCFLNQFCDAILILGINEMLISFVVSGEEDLLKIFLNAIVETNRNLKVTHVLILRTKSCVRLCYADCDARIKVDYQL